MNLKAGMRRQRASSSEFLLKPSLKAQRLFALFMNKSLKNYLTTEKRMRSK